MLFKNPFGSLQTYSQTDGRDTPHGSANALARQKGAPFSVFEHQHTWERCYVQAVYPDSYSCDVYTERGKFLAGIPWPLAGTQAPKRGELYAVHFNLGQPVLERIPKTEASAVPTDKPAAVPINTPARNVGGQDNYYAGKGTSPQRGGRPQDVLPGDWIQRSDDGSAVGVLSGGTAMLKGSDLSQVIATQADHTLRLVGHNLKIDTGAGIVDFKSDAGKTNVSLAVGSDEVAESSPYAENFRVRCDIGAEGDLVDLRVTDGRGRHLYRHHVDGAGCVQDTALRKTSVTTEDSRAEVGTDDVTIVGGNSVREVAGYHDETVSGSYTTDAGGNYTASSAGQMALVALSDLLLSSSRTMVATAGGTFASSDPAMSFSAINGDVAFDIGNPVKGDSQVRNSGFQLNTVTGDIAFQSALGNFTVTTTPGGSVQLGGPIPSACSAVVYELLLAFMQLFGTMIDTHVHPIPALYGSLTLPPVAPPWASTSATFELSKSRFVRVGG